MIISTTKRQKQHTPAVLLRDGIIFQRLVTPGTSWMSWLSSVKLSELLLLLIAVKVHHGHHTTTTISILIGFQ